MAEAIPSHAEFECGIPANLGDALPSRPSASEARNSLTLGQVRSIYAPRTAPGSQTLVIFSVHYFECVLVALWEGFCSSETQARAPLIVPCDGPFLVAQWVEQQPDNPWVVGSMPIEEHVWIPCDMARLVGGGAA